MGNKKYGYFIEALPQIRGKTMKFSINYFKVLEIENFRNFIIVKLTKKNITTVWTIVNLDARYSKYKFHTDIDII